MLDATELRVLGLCRNEPDTQILKSAIYSFQSLNINTKSLERKSSDFVGDLTSQIQELKPQIFVIFVESVEEASRLLSLVKGLVSDDDISKPYWVAITRETGQKELTEQLGELEVDAIFFAPFTPEQITLNLTTGYQGHLEQLRLEQLYQQASETARTAMVAASEIGYVMQLADNLGSASCYEEVGQKLFRILNGIGLKSYLQIYDGTETFLYSESEVNESVQHILTNAMGTKIRLIEHKRLLLLRLDYVIIMVLNAPWKDEARYGRIKDLVCQMGPVLEARVRTIMVNNLIEEQHEKVMSIMNMMRQLSMDTQNNTRKIMHELSTQLEMAAMSLDLSEEHEQHLLGLSGHALDSLETLYSTNDALEGHFLNLMNSITRVRELTNEQVSKHEEGGDDGDIVELF
ncbi:MAG: hypothetical protein MI867_09530 [Pseudomonadales bacterium]|nr:hypothetical protein [Pseudomonadales bacterium]